MTHILHFTITPVQSFIGQSRRTRDLWSSSFLLSWLSGVAMAAVIQDKDKDRKIVFPQVQHDVGENVTDDLLRAIMQRPFDSALHQERHPFIGTLPNRFKAHVDEDFDPLLCVNAVQAKWKELAKLVQDSFLPLGGMRGKPYYYIPKKKSGNPNAQGKGLTETLWDQQVANFWDIQWVMDKAPADRDSTADAIWLDLRKNWRQHIQPDQQEPGDACTLMPGWVELSGHVRTRHQKHQDDFWQAIREHILTVPQAGELNLRKDERLCAVGFIKRMWPKLPVENIRSVFNWVPDNRTRSGGNWPSTAGMAVLPWVRPVFEKEREAQADNPTRVGTNLCSQYVTELRNARNTAVGQRAADGLFSEIFNQIVGIEEKEYFCTVDGRLFYEEGLHAAVKDEFINEARLPALKKALAELHKAHGKPSPFYAVLRMDGDRVGELIGSDAQKTSAGLKKFADQVRCIVDTNHSGATLYAGGDDVLALLAVDDALPCAQALEAAYASAMNPEMPGQGIKAATISAAIVFAHYHLPLSFVMAESDALLNETAKDGNDRNSLAVSVHKPGGEHLKWVSRWNAANASDAAGEPLATLLALADPTGQQKLSLSNGFLYRIRERWGELTDDKHFLPLEFKEDYVRKLWEVDLLANRDLGKVTAESREKAARLAKQLFTVSRDQKNPSPDSAPLPAIRLTEDGALLVRFLATKGVRE